MRFNADFWRPFVAKFLAPVIGALITSFILYLRVRWNIEVDLSSAELSQLVERVIDMVVFAISTGVTAVTINKQVNPGNAASSHLASAEKVESQLIKGRTDQYEAMKENQRRDV